MEPGGTWTPSDTRWRSGRRGVLLVVVAAVPVVFDTTVTPVFALPKFTVAALGALLVVTFGLAENALRRARPGWRNELQVPVLVFVVWTAVSAGASAHVSTSVLGSREAVNGLTTTVVFAALFFAVAQAFDPSQVRTVLSVLWFGSGGVVLAYGAVQLHDRLAPGARWDPIPWINPLGEGAIWSTLGNPRDLAGFLAILLPIGLVLLALPGHALIRGLTALMVVLLLVEMVVTTGRGALLGGGAAVVALAGWFWREICPRVRVVAPVAGVLLVVVVGSATAFLGTGSADRGRGDLLATGEGTTASLRVELWRTSWRMAQENPIFGVGPDAFGQSFDAFRSDRFLRVYGPEILATDPHNLFMSQLAGQGFPGLVALLFLIGSAVVLLLRTRRRLGRLSAATSHLSPGEEEKALLGGVCAALLAYIVQAMFNRHDMVLDLCFWVLLGLACALGRSGEGLGAPASGRPQVS